VGGFIGSCYSDNNNTLYNVCNYSNLHFNKISATGNDSEINIGSGVGTNNDKNGVGGFIGSCVSVNNTLYNVCNYSNLHFNKISDSNEINIGSGVGNNNDGNNANGVGGFIGSCVSNNNNTLYNVCNYSNLHFNEIGASFSKINIASGVGNDNNGNGVGGFIGSCSSNNNTLYNVCNYSKLHFDTISNSEYYTAYDSSEINIGSGVTNSDNSFYNYGNGVGGFIGSCFSYIFDDNNNTLYNVCNYSKLHFDTIGESKINIGSGVGNYTYGNGVGGFIGSCFSEDNNTLYNVCNYSKLHFDTISASSEINIGSGVGNINVGYGVGGFIGSCFCENNSEDNNNTLYNVCNYSKLHFNTISATGDNSEINIGSDVGEVNGLNFGNGVGGFIGSCFSVNNNTLYNVCNYSKLHFNTISASEINIGSGVSNDDIGNGVGGFIGTINYNQITMLYNVCVLKLGPEYYTNNNVGQFIGFLEDPGNIKFNIYTNKNKLIGNDDSFNQYNIYIPLIILHVVQWTILSCQIICTIFVVSCYIYKPLVYKERICDYSCYKCIKT
jgi:hypothetical protein